MHYLCATEAGSVGTTMSTTIVDASTLTDRYQTTIPARVREALGLRKRDTIAYEIQDDGSVVLRRGSKSDADPALDAFLTFLEHDIAVRPQGVQPLERALMQRIDALVGDEDVDLDAPLDAQDE